MRYRINYPQVINETIDGEAIIINLVTGSYYSLDKTGAEVWELIERSLAVGAGSYTVKAQLRIATANSVSSQCQLSAWHFAVERHKRS